MKLKKLSPVFSVLLFPAFLLIFWACDETPEVPDSAAGNLSALTASSGTLSPEFDSATTAYTLVLVSGTVSVTLTPTASDSTNIIKVDGTAVASGAASGILLLAEGINTVSIEVFSSDGTTILKTYTLKIIVGGFKISGTLTLHNGEDGTGKEYIVGVNPDFDSADTLVAGGTWTSGSTQSFELNSVPPGTYYLYALIDWNADDNFVGMYPDYGGLYGWSFDSLNTFLESGTPPGAPNFTVIDKDLVADISDIQQIPDSVTDGTITVNLINAGAHEGYNFGFAVFDDGELVDYIADGYTPITGDGTAGSIAYEDVSAEPQVEFTATGGNFYDIFVLVDLDNNGVTSNGDYTGMIEDVYVNGNVSTTVNFNDMTLYFVAD